VGNFWRSGGMESAVFGVVSKGNSNSEILMGFFPPPARTPDLKTAIFGKVQSRVRVRWKADLDSQKIQQALSHTLVGILQH